MKMFQGDYKVSDQGRTAAATAFGAIVIAMILLVASFAVMIALPVTAAAPANPSTTAGPASVDMGTAGDFAILTKSGISTTGVTLITGDIGVSPIDQTALTGFSETMDSSTEFSRSDYVVGKLYAADYGNPTPTKLTTAVSDMETAYVDAAGRSIPDYTELYAGDITGKTLTPGLYKWGTGVLISAGGVTISGAASDVWIFQIAQDLTVADSAEVNLIGGARANNIFWQVGGGTGVTLGTTSVLNGNVLALKGIVLNTGATLNGRALAQTSVTLDANAVTLPSDIVDTISPTVSSTIPASAAIGVSINSAITATFSEAMNAQTITTSTFTLMDGVTPIAGAVTYAGVTATFRPSADLDSSTSYKATITTGAKDTADNALAASYSWSFTTGAGLDTTAPKVIATINPDGATNVPFNTKVGATFNEAMDPLTITTGTFTLKKGTAPVSGTVAYSGVSAVFTPVNNLVASTQYTATITTGAKDLAGNSLASSYVWRFTTSAAPDTAVPTVSSVTPANSATSVAANNLITATFSEAMDTLTINTATFTLNRGTTPVSGAVTYVGTTATFKPAASLLPSTLYRATITTGAKDLAGNALAGNYAWSFTTSAATHASTVGTIIGRVLDANGDPIAGATVSVDGTSIADTTDANGDYSLSDVPEGAQTLDISADGYESQAVDASVAPGAILTAPDTVLPADANPSDWSWLLWPLIAALAVILVITAIIFSRRKKTFKAN